MSFVGAGARALALYLDPDGAEMFAERGTGNGERNRPLWGFATRGEANTSSEARAEGTEDKGLDT